MNMEVGQSVYVQKNELVFDKWYKAHIIDIRQTKRPASQGNPWLHVVQSCLSVVRYVDNTTQADWTDY